MARTEFKSTIMAEVILPVPGRSAIVTRQTEQGAVGAEVFLDVTGQMFVTPIGKKSAGYELFREEAISGGVRALNHEPKPAMTIITSITPC